MTTDLGPLRVAVSLTAWAVSDAKSRGACHGQWQCQQSPFPKPNETADTPFCFHTFHGWGYNMVSPPMIPSKETRAVVTWPRTKAKAFKGKPLNFMHLARQTYGHHANLWQATGRPIKMGRQQCALGVESENMHHTSVRRTACFSLKNQRKAKRYQWLLFNSRAWIAYGQSGKGADREVKSTDQQIGPALV